MDSTIADFLLKPILEKIPFSKAWPLFERIKKRDFLIRDTGVDSQTINFWKKEKVLDIPREADQRTMRLTLWEYVWVCLVSHYRKIGSGIESIRFMRHGLTLLDLVPQIVSIVKADSALREKMKANDPEGFTRFIEPLLKGKEGERDFEFNMLELLIVYFVMTKSPVSINLLPDGAWFPLIHSKDYQSVWDYYKGLLAWNLYAHASVSAIIRDFLSDEVELKTPRINLLSPNEQRVLEIISSGEYEHVTVHFRDKKIKSLDLTRTQETNKKLVDILSEGKYQEIIIQNHQGYITQIQNTIKLMLD